jgi:hypothetical protein
MLDGTSAAPIVLVIVVVHLQTLRVLRASPLRLPNFAPI